MKLAVLRIFSYKHISFQSNFPHSLCVFACFDGSPFKQYPMLEVLYE
jgi:hypothetical protein